MSGITARFQTDGENARSGETPRIKEKDLCDQVSVFLGKKKKESASHVIKTFLFMGNYPFLGLILRGGEPKLAATLFEHEELAR